MKNSLVCFGENYKYPVFVSVYCKTGFFAGRYRAQTGFTAITDTGKLFVVEYSAFGTSEKEYVFSAQDLKSLKIKKLALMDAYSIKSVFIANGKKFKLDMAVSLKVSGGNFPEQAENAVNFLETLKSWQNYTKE